ncbi:hypothetical protein EIN_327790 [Entamoeba invadens IP1]|uniref:Uncharacterized protein n=1 Tax=Entamoeba invadens IP1 TaxID=370355 RepID=A0A0A1TXL0_ENTIV|nr:hypothetical protein EIN_327790 [Entamoeba invadens IP1]ELP86122.1 hypothetical protein EIN_327790 [Entamoeba invadens IP1]|eukprot:XP_004185468.1 hypothetical protein EIN_327790 [Entamoeba invadens IP1]
MNVIKILQFVEKNVFVFIILSYFLIMAGVVYDMINEPPGMGQSQDEYGHIRPETIMKGSGNGQYVVEGICASFFFIMVSSGFVMVHKATEMTEADRAKPAFAVIGVVISTIGLALIYLFAQVKFGY